MSQLNYNCLFALMLFSGSVFTQTKDCKSIYKAEGYESAYPRLSKDNKKILYQSNKSGKWQIMLMDITGNTHSNITSDTTNNNFPDWNATNDQIAFVSDRDGNEEIYLLNRKSNELKNITNNKERDIHPYFSPDGKYILFNSTRGNGSLDIYRYEIATRKTLQLTSTNDDETCARYSPDMKSIVYLKNGISGDDVYLLNLADFVPENISNTPKTRDGWPMFSPDGKWIYYSSMETGIYNLFRIKPDGSAKKQITNAAVGEEDGRIYLSNNNKFFIYNKRKDRTIEIASCYIAD